jgi:MFS family permease
MTDVTAQNPLRRILDDAPMSSVQIVAVATTLVLSALDGYDVLSVTFAAPAITHDWQVGKTALGIVLSSGLAGMALGSFILAPLADMIGRRLLVLTSLVLMAVGMFFSAEAHSLNELSLWRVVTGLGIGALVAVINALAAEFANAKRRALALSLMAIGYPIGGLIGGLGAAALLQSYGWSSIFFAGFVAAVVLWLAVFLFLPESPAFLLASRRRGSLAKINEFLTRCGHVPIDSLPLPAIAPSLAYTSIFSSDLIRTTFRITSVNVLFVVAVYFVLSWMPQMVSDAGFPPATASLVAAAANITGIFSGLLLGLLAPYLGLRPLSVVVMFGLGVTTIIFGFTPANLQLLIAAAAACGFFLFAGAAGFYATLATTFDASARASGSGFVIGVGRVASAACPFIAGWLFSNGAGRGEVSLVFGISAICAGAILIGLRREPALAV